MGLLQIPRAVFVPPTPIKLGVLTSWLADYTHAVDAQILRDGFSFGFSLGYTGPRQRCDAGCLGSAAARPNVVFAKLNKEIKAGRIAGPFSNCPLERLRCSPIGLVPKKAPGTFRLIHHLSFPQGKGVNAFIDKDKCKVNYASFDVGVRLVLQAGCSAWLAKADIKSAFRLLPVSPRDYELLGFKFGGQFYFDKCLPMGCSISCSLFEKFSTFLEFQVKVITHSGFVTHYLDDFLFVGASRQACKDLLEVFEGTCKALGVPLAQEKTEGPVQTISYRRISN